MNISIKQANALLAALVEDVVVVEDESKAAGDFNVDDTISSIEDMVAQTITPALEQKATETVTAAQAAKMGRMEKQHVAKTFGIAPKELDGLTFEQMLAKAKDVVTKQGGNDDEAQKRIEQMQTDYDERLSTIESERDSYKNKYIGGHITSKLQSYIEEIPRKGGKVEAQVASFKGYVEDKFGKLEYDETNKALSLTKDGKPLFNGNKPYDFKELAKQWADDNGITVTDTRHVEPTKQTIITPGKQGPQSIADFLDKLPANA